uniref:Uncharacterized protein n=1 Tax=Amphimedon queenslandica TaxID=400682 RepID=A0A1X7T813_AMPQE
IDNNEQELRGKLFKATLYATDAIVIIAGHLLFANNTGTALYAVNSRVYVSNDVHINFHNNTGDQGGAVFLQMVQHLTIMIIHLMYQLL